MNKKKVLITAPTHRHAMYYFQDHILSLLGGKLITNNAEMVENESHIFFIRRADENLRGLRVDLIYASNDITLKEYRELLLPLVGSDDKISIF